MEVIQKQICLEDFKNRHYSKHNAHSGNTITQGVNIWGEIPANITMYPENVICELKDTLPLVYGLHLNGEDKYEWESHPRTLEYHTFTKWLYFLKEFERTTQYYKKINNKWLEHNSDDIDFLIFPDSSITTYNYYTTLEEVKDEDNCIIVGINPSAETFNSTFIVDNKRYEREYIKFAHDVLNGEYNYTIHYFNLPLYLSKDIDVIGQYQPLAKLWDPSKKYYVGEIVWWSDESGEIVPFELILNTSKKDKYTQQEDWSIFYTPDIDEDGEVIFDYDVWARYKEDGGIREYAITGATVESRLDNVRRTKTSVDDNGEILPFIINENTISQVIDTETSASTIYYNTDLVFNCGVANVTISNDGTKYCDILNKIKITKDNSSPITYTGNTNGINSSAFTSNLNSIEDGKVLYSGKISFNYTIGAIEEGSDATNYRYGGGITYEEEYNFDIVSKKYEVTLDSDSGTTSDEKNEHFFVYLDIKYGDNMVSIYSTDKKMTEEKRLSTISYKGREEKDLLPIFKDDFLMGIEDIYKDIDVNIDRGMANSAFERLHILSEVKTFEDIENYRNNLFKL